METKRCPYCGEEIMASAKKCKHCGEWLNNEKKKIRCPFCQEETEADLSKCQHCNESLTNNDEEINTSTKTVDYYTFPIKTWKVIRFFIMPLSLIALWLMSNSMKKYLITKGMLDDFPEPRSIISCSIFYFIVGIMFFVLSSYVRSVSNEKNFRFILLATYSIIMSIFQLFFLFFDESNFESDTGIFAAILILILSIVGFVLYILCCSTLFRIESKGVKGVRSLGVYMIFDIAITIIDSILTLIDDHELFSLSILFSILSIIITFFIIIQMRIIFDRFTNTIQQKQ